MWPAGHGKDSQWKVEPGVAVRSSPFCFLPVQDSWYPGEVGQAQCWRGAVSGEVGLLHPSCWGPLPAALSHTDSFFAAGDLGLKTMRSGMDGVLFISREGLNNGATAASVTGSGPDLLGDSGKPLSQTPEEAAEEGED